MSFTGRGFYVASSKVPNRRGLLRLLLVGLVLVAAAVSLALVLLIG